MLLGHVSTGFRAQNVTLANLGQNKSEKVLCAYQGKSSTQKIRERERESERERQRERQRKRGAKSERG